MIKKIKDLDFSKDENGNFGEGIVVIVILIAIAIFVTWFLLVITADDTEYEYAINGKIYPAENCFYDNDAYCMVDGKKIKVDMYYQFGHEIRNVGR